MLMLHNVWISLHRSLDKPSTTGPNDVKRVYKQDGTEEDHGEVTQGNIEYQSWGSWAEVDRQQRKDREAQWGRIQSGEMSRAEKDRRAQEDRSWSQRLWTWASIQQQWSIIRICERLARQQ